jgi:hypothetical protein
MASQRTIRILLCLATLLITPLLSQESKKTETMKVSQDLQQLVMRVFRGEKLEELKSSINPGAYIVDGASYESLLESLYGKSKSATFASERDRQMAFLHMTITDDMSSAHLVVKTETSQHKEPRYHSVFFMKSKESVWQIQDWHTSM